MGDWCFVVSVLVGFVSPVITKAAYRNDRFYVVVVCLFLFVCLFTRNVEEEKSKKKREKNASN